MAAFLGQVSLIVLKYIVSIDGANYKKSIGKWKKVEKIFLAKKSTAKQAIFK